jgi:hypothetical protein
MKKVIMMLVVLITTSILGQDTPKGKIHGYMFGDYFYNIARDKDASSISNAAEKGEKDFNAFQFRRIYLGYDYTISKKFSTRLRLEANQSEKTSGGKVGLFVKDAYLKWKNIIDGSDLIVGFSPTPTFGVSESYWGYRSLAKTIMDLRKIASSRDFGLAAKGKLNSNGSINYWLMVGNGEGNEPEDDKHKSIYAHIAVEPIKDFTITLYGDYRSAEDIPGLNASDMLSNNLLTTAFFAGFKQKGKYSFGLEGFYQTQQNELATANSFDDQTSMGISLFGSADLSEKFSLVGRYDYFDPISNSNYEGDVRNYFLAALNYKADSKVWVMPNIVMETYDNLPDGTEFNSAITGRITLYYKFN